MNYQHRPIDTSGVELPPAVVELTERLAEHAHDVWARERIAQGWTYGPKRDAGEPRPGDPSPHPRRPTAEVTRTSARPERPVPGAEKSGGGVEALVMAPRAPLPEGTKRVFISYAWGDDSPRGRERREVVEGLCRQLPAWGYEVIRDREHMRPGDLISDFMRMIGRGDRIVLILSEKYLRSVFCMTELHDVFRYSRTEKDDFLRRIVPLTLEDARISSIRDRLAHARYWQTEVQELQPYVSDGSLRGPDLLQWMTMKKWAVEVSEILAHIADVLHPTRFEDIVADNFAAVRELLDG